MLRLQREQYDLVLVLVLVLLYIEVVGFVLRLVSLLNECN